MPPLHDSDLKNIHHLEIVEIKDKRYVNLTCPQILVLLNENHPYHEELHTDVLKYMGEGTGIGYTEAVRACVEKYIGFDINDEDDSERYSLLAPMLASWELIELDGAKLE